jgi:hypothetical protein
MFLKISRGFKRMVRVNDFPCQCEDDLFKKSTALFTELPFFKQRSFHIIANVSFPQDHIRGNRRTTGVFT